MVADGAYKNSWAELIVVVNSTFYQNLVGVLIRGRNVGSNPAMLRKCVQECSRGESLALQEHNNNHGFRRASHLSNKVMGAYSLAVKTRPAMSTSAIQTLVWIKNATSYCVFDWDYGVMATHKIVTLGIRVQLPIVSPIVTERIGIHSRLIFGIAQVRFLPLQPIFIHIHFSS